MRKTVHGTVLVPVWAVALSGLVSCASPRGPVPVPIDQWLTGKGFQARSDWSSTALHLRGPQMRSTQRLSQLLRTVSRVRLQPSRDNPLGLTRVLDGNPGSCVLQVYLNGVRLAPRDGETGIDLDARVGVPGLDGLELHLGSDGPVFDPEGCGSLLLWDQSMQHVGDPDFVGSILGRVERDAADAVVDVRLGPDGPRQRVDADGFFHFSGLLPGEYRLDFVVQGQPVAQQMARVYANTEAQMTVRVRGRTGPR